MAWTTAATVKETAEVAEGTIRKPTPEEQASEAEAPVGDTTIRRTDGGGGH